ncbi:MULTISPECIES: hypothetical protein [Halorussus]|uniref:hypothetical protein n=1 Tax=Halorussus TaxID=1070314 RepID=UPI000E20CEF3|nr:MULTISPECIES: hypothetical protein [Halorussus]NHN61525.1 hypothetical protein [Halorussus sp. JP-T4]
MIPGDAVGLFVGAVALGAAHGIEPGHGWPVAASYALDQSNKWLYGFAASLLLGIGHLVSSIAMVVVFFLAKRYFEFTQINDPIELLGVQIGGPVGIVAGVVLILLGIREYFHGHSHSHVGDDGHGHGDGEGHTHDHSHDDHGHGHAHHGHDHSHDDHSHDGHNHSHEDHEREHGREHPHDHHDEDRGLLGKLKLAIPFVGGHGHGSAEEAAERGLWGIAGFAFVLGFAHEEEFEIIAMCAGSNYCLSLMTTYALTVVVGIVTLTLLLIAGYQRYEERVERYTDYLPAFSAAVLILMGLGFVTGLF